MYVFPLSIPPLAIPPLAIPPLAIPPLAIPPLAVPLGVTLTASRYDRKAPRTGNVWQSCGSVGQEETDQVCSQDHSIGAEIP
jgi:hypothetical protein